MARKTSWRSTRKQPKSATKNPRLTRASGGERTVPRKLADADGQIQALRHLVAEPGVSIASSIDTIPPEMVPPEIRERWFLESRQTAVALTLLVERLAGGSTEHHQ
jgi:hypothetical protein